MMRQRIMGGGLKRSALAVIGLVKNSVFVHRAGGIIRMIASNMYP